MPGHCHRGGGRIPPESLYKPQIYQIMFEPLAATEALHCNAINATSDTRKLTFGELTDNGYEVKINTKPVPEYVSLEKALKMEAEKIIGRDVKLMIDGEEIKEGEQ